MFWKVPAPRNVTWVTRATSQWDHSLYVTPSHHSFMMATENELPGQGIPRIVFPIRGFSSSGSSTMANMATTANMSGGQLHQSNASIAQPVPSYSGPVSSPGPYGDHHAVPVMSSPHPRTAPLGPFTATVMSQTHPYTCISGMYGNPLQPNVSPFQHPDIPSPSMKPATSSSQQIVTLSQANTTPTQQLPVTSSMLPINTSLPVNNSHQCSNTNTVSSTRGGSSSHEGTGGNHAITTCSTLPAGDASPSTSTPSVTNSLPFSIAQAVSSASSVPSSPSGKSKPKSTLPSSSLPSLDEFTVSKPINERQNFTNDVARRLFEDEFKKFSGITEFKAYVTEQQRWRWETHNNVTTLETRVKNLMFNPNSGVAQNVTRYKTIPSNAKSEDVKRCEATVKAMDAMANRVGASRTELLHRKGNLLSRNMNVEPIHNEFKFLEQCFSRVDYMYTDLVTARACMNQTLAHLRQNFTQESAAAAEVRRLKRRRKENLRKKRKRKEQTLEKRACEILLKITQTGVLERVWSNPEGQRVSANELLHNQLDALKSVNDVEALKLIISRGYLDPTAVEVVSRKMILLQNGVK
ncbi:uncharacterized protein [Asterias amurensis]|uniref:uncharacterized protein isoform X1 n=2 Tax=Asterias amurensis TaxID=7602 RepID=UPI003AB7EBB9